MAFSFPFFVFCWGLGGKTVSPPTGFDPHRHTPTFLRVTKFAAGPWVGVELDPRNPLERRGVGNVTVVRFFSEGLIRTTDATSQRGGKGGVWIYCMFSCQKMSDLQKFF